jgi:hypothetical protein
MWWSNSIIIIGKSVSDVCYTHFKDFSYKWVFIKFYKTINMFNVPKLINILIYIPIKQMFQLLTKELLIMRA